MRLLARSSEQCLLESRPWPLVAGLACNTVRHGPSLTSSSQTLLLIGSVGTAAVFSVFQWFEDALGDGLSCYPLRVMHITLRAEVTSSEILARKIPPIEQ